jgi:indole-3-acetate monooxygenase
MNIDVPIPRQAVADPVQRARQLRPLIEGAAGAIEGERALPPKLLAALHNARLFRLLLPKSCGGEEVAPAMFVAAVEEVAKADASVAWCMAQGSGCSMAAAYLEPAVAQGNLRRPRGRSRLGPRPRKRQSNSRGRGVPPERNMALCQRQPPCSVARRPRAAGRCRKKATSRP